MWITLTGISDRSQLIGMVRNGSWRLEKVVEKTLSKKEQPRPQAILILASYKALYNYFKQKNVQFIWITDGGGWKSAESAIEETFIATDYIFNLKMIQDGILDEVFV